MLDELSWSYFFFKIDIRAGYKYEWVNLIQNLSRWLWIQSDAFVFTNAQTTFQVILVYNCFTLKKPIFDISRLYWIFWEEIDCMLSNLNAQEQVNYLGYIIYGHLSLFSKSFKELRLNGYLRRFIRGYGILRSLTKSLKKHVI
jgi:hypothetical protein